ISLLGAWRDIFHQWNMAFRIASIHRRQGTKPSTWREILGDWNRARHEHRNREQALLEAEISEKEVREKGATNRTPIPSAG
ncbi:MAG: hypothetical protein MK209_09165, partial [Planctomycetes bacterium]|nr:hypothetical protein [Planctomycetota bacterium]